MPAAPLLSLVGVKAWAAFQSSMVSSCWISS
jgi:hypothetical protein